MFERFTKGSRQVMVLCQDEARKLRHNVIAPHHLALGLLRLEEERGGGPLTLSGVDLPALRESIEAEAGRPMPTGTPGVSPPFTPESKRVLGDALKEALQMGDNFIGPGHQLLALIKGGSPAALTERLPIEQALQAVREHHRTDESDRPARGGSRTKPRLRGFVEVMKSAMSRSTPGTPTGSQHILLTLVSRKDTLAGKILAELGVTEEKVRELIETIGTEGTLDEPPPPEVEIRVSGRSLGTVRIEPIDLIAAVREKDPDAAERLLRFFQSDEAEPPDH